jgi:hypothetical protein
MFGGWLFVRLHAAEKALRQGRIDDACAAALEADIRQHSRGQRLADDLVRPLVARARLHRQAGRFAEALVDLDRLAALGRCGPDVQTLRQQVQEEMRKEAARAAERQQARGKAADRLQAGRLESVRLDLPRVEDTQQRQELAEELDFRVQRAGQLLGQAAEALEHDDVLAAMGFWQQACQRYGHTQESEGFAGRLGAACRQAVEQWLAEGRIERLIAARDGLASLAPLQPTLADCERAISLCSRAAGELAAGDHPGLRRTLLRLKAATGEVAWVQTALEALAGIAAGHDALMASPLGLLATTAGGKPPAGVPRTARRETPTPAQLQPTVAADPAAVRLDRPLLMLVDGGGSSLLVHQERVRIGRGGSTAEVDVPIPGEVKSHHADIVRHGDDYFLTAYGPVEVNRRRVEHALLRDGDRIALGPQAKMVFCKPNSKSESAALRLSHRCRLPQDVSSVILFRQTCLIGPTASCHVRVHEGRGQVVLFERGGALHGRVTGGQAWQAGPVEPVPAGQTVDFGEVRLTVKPYEVQEREAGIRTELG